MIKEITLTDGEKVKLNTSLSLQKIKDFQDAGLMSETFFTNIMKGAFDPTSISYNDLIDTPYICYKNANPDGLSSKEFNEKTMLDIQLLYDLYGAIVYGEDIDSFSKSFHEVTPKKK